MLTKQALDNLKLGTGGSYSLARDAINHRLWDVRTFATPAVDYTFFSQPVSAALGATGFNKTINETNLYDTGKLPNGQTFLVERFGVACIVTNASYQPDMVPHFYNVLNNSVFEIRLAGREYDFQIHGRNLLPMPAVAAGIPASAAARVGDMIASGWYKMAPTPIFIDQLVSFSVVQRLGNPITAVKTIIDASAGTLGTYYGVMMIVLDGFLTRAK